MTNDLEVIAPAREPDAVWRPSGAIDPVRLEALWGLSARIATASVVPMSLRGKGLEGRDGWEPFPEGTVIANVFAVVEQADRWGMSPFALLACAAIVHGRLGFEGKVIADVLESRYQIKLSYSWSGNELSDDFAIEVTGFDPSTGAVLTNAKGEPLTVKGTVKGWRTTGNNSPWRVGEYRKMLAYRGAREWARLHKPGAIMGTNSIDELAAYEFESRAQVAEDKTGSLAERYKPGAGKRSNGFSPSNISQIEDARDQQQVVGEIQQEQPKETVPANTEKPRQEPMEPHQAKAEQSIPDNAPRLSAALFAEFSTTLLRVSDATKVDRMGSDFWSANGGWPPASNQDASLAVKIAKAHKSRCDGKLSIDDLKVHVGEIIDESFGAEG